MNEEGLNINVNGTSESTSSFEVTKNTKGYCWKIKIYSNDLDELKQKSEELDNYAKEHYTQEDV